MGRIRALTSGIRNAATAGAPILVAIVVQRSGPHMADVTLAAIGAVAALLTLALPGPPRPIVRVESTLESPQ